jgi:hypothetical protein
MLFSFDEGNSYQVKIGVGIKIPFTLLVIPGLTRNPRFLTCIPAGVYPVLDTGQN